MFRRILIANRGEIAARIIDTCRRMGVETVAVFSDADRTARHVQMADRAVHIGGPAPADSYLRIDRIVEAARETGAEAIHPGYGFLSENPDFVDAIETAGLVFIGPSADAMRQMGLKDAAKAVMKKAGVPVVPGYHGVDQADVRLAQEAAKIGWPVMIKAVAGGGGKGMRLVEEEADFKEALASARAEAKGAFGNDSVLIEKAITRPRHIEVQVFGDGTEAIHLFERDCSLQRRHQKVIEEAPAPGMTDAMRKAMGDAAVLAAEAIGYKGAGTIEFIVEGGERLSPDGFYFMEMNTRLQVEHPVTEEVTGVDLVEWQLRVAAGEALPVTQESLAIRGHAVEARLYAEDASSGFLPATGRIAALDFPDGLRVETGIRAGDEITPHYDPMIAKIIAHGPTRDIAFQRLSDGLGRLRVAGTVTNAGFLKALVDHPQVRSGEVETGLIGRDINVLTAKAAPGISAVSLAALCATGLDAPGDNLQGFALWGALGQTVSLVHDGEAMEVRVACVGKDRRDISCGDRAASAVRTPGGWRIDAVQHRPGVRHGNRVTVDGAVFDIVDPLAVADEGGLSGDAVLAPMPGRVVRLNAEAGEKVEAGRVLAVLEAMKMEHSLRAPRDGRIAEVLVTEGAQVSAGDALVILEGDDTEI
ncbi:acetyl/propionyl/methylcrotonyl-CoA carboxylase subunit alpha [Palleronia abyssalis]|uniref:Acetyl-/propionyl-coenzyme A carboxylase alpha chain n=1 Tax=Palleronia abyssalis TaxID=1501240 RepID=A0A2R8BRV4_9RHOB|nr:acetyl/propionyl/methylcrotonyl-CoA carboxylase subunit alpha [Palleronia abyssalis]SPJ22907.1 Acetyl-/propionyl-coenzyme A carboxylase alpha chain [Palleronia abyssalis]